MGGSRFSSRTLLVALLSTLSAVVSAQNITRFPVPITIGQLGFSHGHAMLAWTPTKTTLNDVCVNQTSRTTIQVVQSGFPSNPLCGYPFEVDGFRNLTLLCSDGTDINAERITAIATDGKQSHNCTDLPLTIGSYSCGGGSGVWQRYACQ